MSADPPRHPKAGSVLYCWDGPGCREQQRLHGADELGAEPFDVVIIGAGVVGCALAYELSRFELRVLVLEAKYDVGEATSKGNSAIIHTGFDATPGTLESQFVTRASRLWPALAERLKVPMRSVGAVLVALDGEQLAELPDLHAKAGKNGVEDVELISAEQVRRMEPYVAPDLQGGLLVPRESIIDPFSVPIAFAELAVANGVHFVFGVEVRGIEDADRAVKHVVDARGHRFAARRVVNVAGLGSQRLARGYHGTPFSLNPRRGQFLVYDKNVAPLVSRILLPTPTPTTKGKLVAPTIFGNLLAGPTAEDLPWGAAEATSTTIVGLTEVRDAAWRLCPSLVRHRPIASYAGARCNCAEGSYQIRVHDGGNKGVITVSGIRSTGLTASPALAEHLASLLQDKCGLELSSRAGAVEQRAEKDWPGWWKRPYEDPARVASEPDYGRITCFCETISKGEIKDALNSALAPQSLDAIKRRTRTLMGRCQGFNCLVHVAGICGEHHGIPWHHVTKHGPGSTLLPTSG
jgi:glycerol-3-phosphate dehydrogenase